MTTAAGILGAGRGRGMDDSMEELSWRTRCRLIWRSRQGRLGAYGATLAVALGACAPQCAPATTPDTAAPAVARGRHTRCRGADTTAGQRPVLRGLPVGGGLGPLQLAAAHVGQRAGEHLPIGSGFPGEHDMACGGPDTTRSVAGGQAGDAVDVARFGPDLVVPAGCRPLHDGRRHRSGRRALVLTEADVRQRPPGVLGTEHEQPR